MHLSFEHAREDVAALGQLAGSLDAAARARSVFAGDFNLAPEDGLKPEPCGAFAGVCSAGFRATNFEPTNLCEVVSDGHGMVYDNFLVHESRMREDSLTLTAVVDGDRAEQFAYVLPVDQLMLEVAELEPLKFPRAWLLESLKGAVAAASPDEELAEEDGGGSAAEIDATGANPSRVASASPRMGALGLFDHRFSFIQFAL